MANPLTALIEEIQGTSSRFQPEKIVPDVEDYFKSLPDLLEEVATLVKNTASKGEEWPVNQAVVEGLREVIPALDGAVAKAREANETFRSIHRQELDQHHDPRKHERAWNVE